MTGRDHTVEGDEREREREREREGEREVGLVQWKEACGEGVEREIFCDD